MAGKAPPKDIEEARREHAAMVARLRKEWASACAPSEPEAAVAIEAEWERLKEKPNPSKTDGMTFMEPINIFKGELHLSAAAEAERKGGVEHRSSYR
jgi:hypothetical protein